MKALIIGLGLVGGAAWLGRRSGGLGALAKAITPGMDDSDYVDEFFYRADRSFRLVDSASRDLYDEATDELSPNPMCNSAIALYGQARKALKESGEAIRAGQYTRILNDCNLKPGLKNTERCRRANFADSMHREAKDYLAMVRRDIKRACGKTVPAPFAGLA